MQHRRCLALVSTLLLAGFAAACSDPATVRTTGPTDPSHPTDPTRPDHPADRRHTPGTTLDPDDPRAGIDPEAYFLDYAESAYEMATVNMSADAAAPTGAAPPGAYAPMPESMAEPMPIPLPEPGPGDDNTFIDAGESAWVATGDDRESTFALDVDTGSYRVAQAFLTEGYRPEPDSIRAEEWINAFGYGDPPAIDHALAATVEAGAVDGQTMVRIGVSTGELSGELRPPAHVTFVIDTSGSMDIRERLGLVKSSLALLVRELRPDDTVAIVTYGSDAAPLLAPTPITEWERIVAAIDELQPGGSTNMEAGLLLGYEQARATLDPTAVNVVVLASDGVANVGVTGAEELTAAIADAGRDGIHLVTVGYGMGNYNDHLMEQLADRGDGFYSYVDTYDEAERLFVEELTPTLAVVAEQAKVQVVFDEHAVARYRLIGYANRALDDSQFTDDTVDAGELGAGHQVSAIYEIDLVDGIDVAAAPTVGTVRLRWADPATAEVTETQTPIVLSGAGAPTGLRLAALVGHAAEVLRGDTAVTERGLTLDSLATSAGTLAADGVDGAAELAALIDAARAAAPPDLPIGPG